MCLTITYSISSSVQQLGVSWKGDLPEVEVWCVDMVEVVVGLCFFDQIFEDADIFVLWNFDSECSIRSSLRTTWKQLSERNSVESRAWATMTTVLTSLEGLNLIPMLSSMHLLVVVDNKKNIPWLGDRWDGCTEMSSGNELIYIDRLQESKQHTHTHTTQTN